MSTFNGIIQEFPFITIDYFRKNPERPPPLACFLSHAHSDHLQGLESFRAPFIYCSAATRELLLQIEKYPHRMNFNNGILESRKQHYKHLSKLLRPIPLNAPTEIDLTPRLSIRVTLLDANHCTGAVMFLIEGGGKAILYTGDIRAEPWWVDSLIRHPILIPYTLGNRRLDKVYLDTTFAHASHTFHSFPTKSEGIAELLRKLKPYPEDTVFYFRAWTFGYEGVWVALAAALRSKIHVDRYQIGLYKSVSSSCREGSGAIEAPSLCGFELGNRIVPGCLSEDERSRIHSCEPGAHCSIASSKKTVYITPIVSRTEKGSDVPEVGAGGGLGDLYQIHELELPDQSSLTRLEQLCSEKIHDPQALSKAKAALSEAFESRSKALPLDSYGMKDAHEIPLDELVNILSRGRLSEESTFLEGSRTPAEILDRSGNPLPKTIRFPYSRHSSYAELCDFVAAFKPQDIYSCTVDPLDWDEDISIQSLFGHLCSDNKFAHDQYMRNITATANGEPSRKKRRHDPEYSTQSTQKSTTAGTDHDSTSQISHISIRVGAESNGAPAIEPRRHPVKSEPPTIRSTIISSSPLPPTAKTPTQTSTPQPPETVEDSTSGLNNDSLIIPSPSPRAAKAKRNAIRQAWHLLDAQNTQHKQFHLGSLPSSWPTDDENSQTRLSVTETQALEEIVERSSQVTTYEVGPHDYQFTHTVPVKKTPLPMSEENPSIDVVMDSDSNTEHNDLQISPHNSSQQSHANTISSSAFASQSQDQMAREDELETISDGGYISDHEHEHLQTNDQTSNSNPKAQAWSKSRESSTRNRMAAYAAAKEDSYDAWASMPLVSAGNNHTDEEVEL
ncbi:hypothetical protein BDW62DRAFT_217633 [Aspergillus aurantiobrunneus]